MDGKHGRRTSGVACHHSLRIAHTVERRRAWHAIIAFGQHRRSKDVARGRTSPPLDSAHGRTTSGTTCHYLLWKAHTIERRRVWHASSPLGSTHGRTTSGVPCHHGPWIAHTVERRRAWHAITALGLHARSDDVGRGMTSPPGQHTQSDDVGCGMASPPLGSTHGRTTSGVV